MSIRVGDKFFHSKKITEKDIRLFADISGDYNPLHLDPDFASRTIFRQRIAHGMLTASLISAALASMPGTIILLSFCLSFEKPVYIGDELEAKVTVKRVENSRIRLEAEVTKQKDIVISGNVEILRK